MARPAQPSLLEDTAGRLTAVPFPQPSAEAPASQHVLFGQRQLQQVPRNLRYNRIFGLFCAAERRRRGLAAATSFPGFSLCACGSVSLLVLLSDYKR